MTCSDISELPSPAGMRSPYPARYPTRVTAEGMVTRVLSAVSGYYAPRVCCIQGVGGCSRGGIPLLHNFISTRVQYPGTGSRILCVVHTRVPVVHTTTSLHHMLCTCDVW